MPLRPYRVLDLTEGHAALGPMMLAGLGADVVRIEPPYISASRLEAPLDPDGPDGMASLSYLLYNRGKRAVTLDLTSADGKASFLELVAGAEFLFENAKPGAMAALGLGYDDLVKVNPALVYVATTPFGQDGPYANHATSDITLAAMGGQVALNGDADRTPVRISVPQTWLHAAAESAAAAMVAHFRRLGSGEGQFVDVSVQAAVFWTGLNAMIHSAITGKNLERAGTLLQLGTIDVTITHPAADGEVVLLANGATMTPMVHWLIEEGIVPSDWIDGEDWKSFDLRVMRKQPTRFTMNEVAGKLGEYTSRHKKLDLLARGMPLGVTIAPVSIGKEVMDFGHLHERNYWQDTQLPSGKHVLANGEFVRLSKTPIHFS
ncbi:hypothetical protein AYO38_11140, partial [bacterium SCGC AG-212-C10]